MDFVLSRDTHEPIVRGETWVVEPGSFGSFLGRLDFTIKGGKVAGRRWELVELRADRFAEDRHVKHVVDETLAPVRPRLDKIIGETKDTLMRYNVVETGVVDALREAAGTEIALSNGFRFAPPLLANPVKESDLWDWYPITTRPKVGKVTGRQLRAFCEREGDEPDKLCRIPHVRKPRVLGMDAHETVRQYLARHSPLPVLEAGRVVAEDLPSPVRSQVLIPKPERLERSGWTHPDSPSICS